eukprot:13283426-Alexandrium_andersonii.AAC.1
MEAGATLCTPRNNSSRTLAASRETEGCSSSSEVGNSTPNRSESRVPSRAKSSESRPRAAKP